MLEGIILAACLSSPGACSPALRAYYLTDRPVVQIAKKIQYRANTALSQYPEVAVLAPFISYAATGRFTIKITRNISTTIGKETSTINYVISL